ncbi:MAG: efflux RND transporter permease subunit [Deltaproteobacteria bacterium]|nr:efflux RND transporter permease subunit [Deltaproteobacteria bacterium]MBI3390957.1 efflux RND transporter permease subunit [Deltaproteobacteria bacterium]
MRLADICIRRPVFATMLIAFLVVLGLFSYRRLAVDLFPNIDFPIVTITTTLKGAGVEEMETGVTKPLEEAINTIEGIDELRSVTKEGLSQIIVIFLLERQREAAAQDVRDKVASILSQLPEGTDTPVVDKFDVESSPILSIAVSGNRDLREVTEIARKLVKEDIETLKGVGSVSLTGGLERAINITVDTGKLAAYNLSVQQVKAALRAQNLEIPGGRVDQGQKEMILRTMGRITSVADFQKLIVGNVQGRPITIADVARVTDSFVEPRTLARLDDRPAVSLLVRKQSGTNTVQIIDVVKQRLDELRKVLPQDIQLEVIRDHSRFIKRSIDEVQFHLILAAVLVSLTVMLFIANLRATLIAAIAIPTSIISTFTLMNYLGFTLNNLTMLGLVLSTGVVIDDAVVVLENIFRHMEERGEDAMSAAQSATREISLAVMATTLSLVVIFLPVAFMSGRVGRFFNSYGITVACSIMVSLLISFTLTPMLCSRFLKVKHTDGRSRDRGIYPAIERLYGAVLHWSLEHRWVIIALSIATVYSTGPLFRALGKDFLPQDDQSEFEVIVQTPDGYSLNRSEQAFKDLEQKLRALPGVTHLLSSIGDVSGRLKAGSGPVTQGSIYVRLVDLEQRALSQKAIMSQARQLLEQYPDLRTSVQNVNLFAGGGQRQTEIELDLTGPSLEKLEEYSNRLIAGMRVTKGIVDVDTTLSVRQPELRVEVSRQKASEFGIKVQDIAATLQTLVGGEPVTKYKEEQDQYDVWLRAELLDRSDPHALSDIMVATPRGELVKLANLATLSEERGPAQIDRANRQRKVTIVANLDGIPLNVATEQINAIIAGLDFPPMYRAEFSGRAKALGETGRNFFIAFLLSLIFMYMILAAQFESFLHPITILLALPLSIPFALVSLLIMGDTLNIYSVLGLFMLFGIVKKNGILQIDYTNTLRRDGWERDAAILAANQVRLRPILMTTVMLVAGMIPIALGRGPGSATRASMAKVIIGGQALCLLLSLLLTPVAYSLFDDLGQTRWLTTLGGWIRGAAARVPLLGAWANGRRPA